MGDTLKKDKIEFLGFEDEEKRKVGRPKLADKETKKKSIIIACASFLIVILLLIFGYGTLFGFKDIKLLGSASKRTANKENVLVNEIKPIIQNVVIKEKTARKLYLTVLPANASNKDLRYKSSNEDVASVDSNGKVIGKKEGNAVITVNTLDGSNKETTFKITVVKNAEGKCDFKSLTKNNDSVDYNIECNNASIKEIQYKISDGKYESLNTKKNYGTVNFSKIQLKDNVTFKVVYYPNNSKISKYSTKNLKINTTTTKEIKGSCTLDFKDVKSNSLKYNITCNNASVTKIAYKIGNGSYVGIDPGYMADTILYEESDVTRVIYFNVDYKVNGSSRQKTITKSNVIMTKNKESEQ